MFFSKTSRYTGDFPGGPVVKNPPANAGDMGLTLVQEDSTCQGATKLVSHHYRAHVLQLLKPESSRAHGLQQEKPPQWEAQAPQPEKAQVHNKGTAQPKINKQGQKGCMYNYSWFALLHGRNQHDIAEFFLFKFF